MRYDNPAVAVSNFPRSLAVATTLGKMYATTGLANPVGDLQRNWQNPLKSPVRKVPAVVKGNERNELCRCGCGRKVKRCPIRKKFAGATL